jgi:hypothetical protein
MDRQSDFEEFLKKRGEAKLDKFSPELNLERFRETRRERFDEELAKREEARREKLENWRGKTDEIQHLKRFEREIDLRKESAEDLYSEVLKEALSREKFSVELRRSQKEGFNVNFSPVGPKFGGGLSNEETLQIIIKGEGARLSLEQPKKEEEGGFWKWLFS